MGFKCFFKGHKWKQEGFKKVQIFSDEALTIPLSAHDCFLYHCKRCGKFKEKKLKQSYTYVNEDKTEPPKEE